MTHWEWLMEISSSWSGGKVGILGQEEASFLQMNCQSPTDYAAACESFAPNSSSATLVPLFLLCPLGTPFSSLPCLIRALCCLFLLLTQKHLKPTPTLWSHKGGGWGVAPVEFHRWISHLVSSLQKLKRGCKCSFTKAFSRLLTWQRMPSLLLKVSNPSLPLHTLAALCLPKSQSPPISLSLCPPGGPPSRCWALCPVLLESHSLCSAQDLTPTPFRMARPPSFSWSKGSSVCGQLPTG